MTKESAPTILIVDDDPQVMGLFESILERDYNVVVAESGEAALDIIDKNIDVCLVDRRMPGLVGEEVVLRFRENGFDQPIALVSAVVPDFDVIDVGFDDYVVKPVTATDLQDVVESLVLSQKYDDILREYSALASKVTALRSSKTPEELTSNDDYRVVVDTLNEIEKEAKHSHDAAIEAGLLEESLWESFFDGQSVEIVEPGSQ